jgi:hypothetical protein
LTMRTILLLYSVGAFASLCLAVIARSLPALLSIAASLILLLAVWLIRGAATRDRQARKLVFRMVAPGLGFLALGSLIALGDLTH